jgi:hypothetical protein
MLSRRLFAFVTVALIGASVGANAQSVSKPSSAPIGTPTGTIVATRSDSVAAAPANTVAATSVEASPIKIVELEPKNGKLADLLKAEAAKAVAAGLTPFVDLGGPWCSICVKLQSYFNDKDMIDAFKGTYIIGIDPVTWRDDKDLAPQYQKVLGFIPSANKGIGLPAFFALDSTGMIPLDSAGVILVDDTDTPTTDQIISAPDIHTGEGPAAAAKTLKKFFSQNMRKVRVGPKTS